MPKILIDILPAQGHLNGSLKLALMLKNAGYEVLYLNMKPFQIVLEKFGFPTSSNNQYERQFEISKRRFNFKFFINGLFFTSRKKILEREKLEFQSFKRFIADIKPDLVLLDDQNMLKAAYYKMCDVPVVCLDNLPESGMLENIPPYSSFFIPSKSLYSKLFCKVSWCIKTFQNNWRLTKIQLNSIGTDFYSATIRIAKQNNLQLRGQMDLKRGYGLGIKNIHHIIVAPVDFDFPHKVAENVFNIGPLVDIKREGEINRPRYNTLRKNLEDLKMKNKVSFYIVLWVQLQWRFSEERISF